MLFNSYEFMFLFLPVTVGLFFLLGRRGTGPALGWLIAASLFFYAWWRPLNVLIMAPSVALNYLLARLLLRYLQENRPRIVRVLLIAGIAFNIAFLGYFKYANFLTGVTDDVFGTRFVLERIILPLGISFITFQKIGFLVDVAGGRVRSFTLRDYLLFVMFFPQLIAGPIVHFREVMPQFERASCRFDGLNVALGSTLFFAGLFKKTVLADGIAPFVSPIYEQAAAGHPVALVQAWMAAIGFTLQIYFDFSGYSDMAIGIARLFGIKLPPNFNSPLRARNIIGFWAGWHMTLTRFLTAYLYNPLTLWLTRRRLARGLKGLGGRNTTPASFLHLLILPTLFTMAISGLWHGAGYTFILWGLINGVYLVINHAWIWMRGTHRLRWGSDHLLTFVCIVAAMTFFRAPTLASAWNVLTGMFGAHGISLPLNALDRLPDLVRSQGFVSTIHPDPQFFPALRWMLALLALALIAPNTQQMLERYEPALGVKAGPVGSVPHVLEWKPSLAWGLGMAVVAGVGVAHIAGVSEFLYWQF